ncbi:hypothetical protein BDV12DRAFT_203981 [Aspergillus spectabilis]
MEEPPEATERHLPPNVRVTTAGRPRSDARGKKTLPCARLAMPDESPVSSLEKRAIGILEQTRRLEILEDLTLFSHHTAATFPLFREETLEWVTSKKFSDPQSLADAQFWASLNVALSIGYKFESLCRPDSEESRIKSDAYLKNALAAVPNLILLAPTLMTVQALLGIMYLARSSLESPISEGLLILAIRFSHDLGLHRSSPASMTMSEPQSRVFWLGYLLDKSTCIAQGLTPCQNDDQVSDIELPALEPMGNAANYMNGARSYYLTARRATSA